MRVLRGIALALGSFGLVGLAALPARAADGLDIAGGYSYVYDNDGGTSFPAGWFFSAGAKLSDGFALVGDISGNYKSETVISGNVTANASLKIHTFLAGPRVIGRAGQIGFYGQFLIGAATASGGVTTNVAGTSFAASASDTEFCFAPGAGIELGLGSNSGVRVGMNERLIRANGNTSREFQLQIGLVYRFGQ